MKILSTPRLHLSLLSDKDSDFILELLNDRDFIANIADRGVRTTEDALGYIMKLRERYETPGQGFYLVTDQEQNKVGISGIIHREGLEDPDVGFAFLPAYRGLGYASESARAVMDKAVSEYGMKRISAIVSAHNASSIRVVEKLGLSYDKIVRLNNEEVLLYVWEKKR